MLAPPREGSIQTLTRINLQPSRHYRTKRFTSSVLSVLCPNFLNSQYTALIVYNVLLQYSSEVLFRSTSYVLNKTFSTFFSRPYWVYGTVALMVRCSVRLPSVHLSVTFCIVAKRYVVEGRRWYRWIGR